MRVLDRNRVQLDFEQLGFDDAHIASLQQLMAHPNGIVLVTGPTGSGKTTTLYTILKQLNQPAIKIFTGHQIEQPLLMRFERRATVAGPGLCCDATSWMQRSTLRMAVEAARSSRRTASRQLSPPSTKATTRSLKSVE
jgi:Tfp pilus assembly pilus retraction ATPase PilT